MSIRGIAFPFRKGTALFPEKTTDNDTIKDNIARILQTPRGERVMRPKTGSKVLAFVFENAGPVLNARIDHEVRKSIAAGEPRANVLNVSISEESRNDGGVNVMVTIIFVANNEVEQVQVPFSQPVTEG